MSFPKLTAHLIEGLTRVGYDVPTPIQLATLARIKSGADVFCLAPDGAGKTTAMVISVIQRLESIAVGEASRALIFVKDKEAALALEESFRPFLRFSNLRIFSAFDQHDITGQKDTIYHGNDILIGTPSRLSKLFFLNGVNMSQLKMIIIDDAQFLSKSTDHISIIRICESAKGCQNIVFADKNYPRFDQLRETVMRRAVLCEISES